MHTTSASLLGRLRESGDVDAWSRFVHLYTPILYSWARKMGLRHDDSADLVQDVFAVLVQKLPGFQYNAHGRFRGWLWTITKQKWIDRRRRAVLPLDSSAIVDDAEARAEPSEIEETEFRDYLIRSVVPSLRGHFHDTTWRAFWSQVVDGRPAAAVAEELGLSVAVVYKAKLRVLARLNAELADLDSW
jgi:RNA polymerase sigma factor (sigma-70 family)